MKACNITQAACQAIVYRTTWLKAASKLLGYRTRLSWRHLVLFIVLWQILQLIYGCR